MVFIKKILVTGGTGFIGRNLIESLLEDNNKSVTVLTEPNYVKTFEQMLSSYKKKYNNLAGRLDMLIGDITQDNLGLEKTPDFDEIYHLAAIYLLEVKKGIAEKVNVEGTRNVVSFAKRTKNLEAFNYFSTCYVSGKREGTVYEDELDKGQKFNNHYEETKFMAETIVRGNMKNLPTRIFRPAITVGNSKTGETVSFNGLYFAFDAFERTFLGYPCLLALPGNGDSKVNFIPVDYLINAVTAISSKKDSIGMTFQIADPKPLTANEVIKACCEEFNVKKPLLGHMPYHLAKISFDLGLGKLLKIQKELIPYMNSKTEYDTTNTSKALEGTGVECPKLGDYITVIADYWRKHK